MYFLAYVCSEAVMNPWGKKNTGRGNAAGWPETSHVRIKATLKTKSLIQEPSVLSDAKESFSQMEGSWLLRKAVYILSKSALITIMP